MENFFIENWQILVGIIAGAIGWFKTTIFQSLNWQNTKAAGKASVYSTNIENLAKTLEIYKELLDDILSRYELELKEYKDELKYYRAELEKYRLIIKEREKTIVSLEKEISILKSK